jgi:hypothetical protein
MIRRFFFSAASIFILLSTFLCCRAVLADDEESTKIPEPVILSAIQINDVENSQILVSGLMATGYNVIVYINGKYSGVANISQITNNFTKFSFLSEPLNSNQNFEIMVIGQDQISLKFSAPALISVKSIIEKNYFFSEPDKKTIKPAISSSSATAAIDPPMLNVAEQKICIPNPDIFGSVKNQNKISIYVDDKLSAIIPVNKQSANTFVFNYSPTELERGQHSVYAIAQDKDGNKSAKSKTLFFCVSSPQIITATSAVAEIIEQTPTSSLVFQKTNDQKPANNKQKNTLNLFIFFAFLAGLGTWMALVNRELSGENNKTDQNKSN